LHNKLQQVAGSFDLFTDSVNGTEMRILNFFYGGTLATGDTLEFCKVKAVSLAGLTGLRDLLDKGITFMENYDICFEPNMGWGMCGDVNYDAYSNLSDAVCIVNYVFIDGPPPYPNYACGDVNEDFTVNVSDAIYIINFVFMGGSPPGDCAPEHWDIPCWPYQEHP